MAGTQKRKPAVSKSDFIIGIRDGAKAGLTAQQVADKLGMGKGSFDQRLNQLRMDWFAYMVVITLKLGGALAEVNKLSTSKKFNQQELDEYVAELRADGTYEGVSLDDTFLVHTDEKGVKTPKPFPYVLADGRGEGNGGGGKRVDTTRNAIFAAMMGVDAKSPETEPDAE